MGKKKKSGNEKPTLDKVILITAIISLIKEVVELIQQLLD